MYVLAYDLVIACDPQYKRSHSYICYEMYLMTINKFSHH